MHPTHWLIFTQTATGSATSNDAGPGTRGFFDRGPVGGDVARFPSGDGKADRAASSDDCASALSGEGNAALAAARAARESATATL